MNKYQIAIVYRIYPEVSKTPPVFNNDKYKLSELCLASFKDALEDIKYKLYVILDDCPPEYKKLFEKYFPGDDVEYIELGYTGNAGTFGKQMDILLKQDYADTVYFAEDDYFYLPGAFGKMLDFIHSSVKPDFITPFDHLDYYKLKFHHYPYQTVEAEGHKWRTAATTCMTFMTRKETLAETEKVFRSYTKNNYDASLWLALTKIHVFNPVYILKILFSGSVFARILAKTWSFTAGQLLRRKRYKLYAPKPSLSTHMDNFCLAPDIDWNNKFNKKLKKINF